MDLDLVSIIRKHRPKSTFNKKNEDVNIEQVEKLIPVISELPDILFDEILVEHKLQRIEILVLIYLYRKIWCLPNIYAKYGIGPMLSLNDISKILKIDMDDLQRAIRKLESLGIVETIRIGQYFIRKYFTEKNDAIFGQTYDDF